MLVGREALLAAGDAAVAGRARGPRPARCSSAVRPASASRRSRRPSPTAPEAGGPTVRVGACWEAEGLPPFTPWLDALRRPADAACADVAERLAGGDDGRHRRRQRGPGARPPLRGRRRRPPRRERRRSRSSCVLEDLHWADAPSLELLAALAPRLRSMPVLVVGHLPRRRDAAPEPARGARAARPSASRWRASMPTRWRRSSRRSPAGPATTAPRPRCATAPAATRCSSPRWPACSTPAARRSPPACRTCSSGASPGCRADCVEVLGAAAVLGHEFDRAAAGRAGRRRRARRPRRGARGSARRSPARATRRAGGSRTPSCRPPATARCRRPSGRRCTGRAVDVLRGQPGRHRRVPRPPRRPGALRSRRPHARRAAGGGRGGGAGRPGMGRRHRRLRAGAGHRTRPADVGDEVRAEAWLGIGAVRLRQDRPDVREAFDEVGGPGPPTVLARTCSPARRSGSAWAWAPSRCACSTTAQIDLLEEAVDGLLDETTRSCRSSSPGSRWRWRSSARMTVAPSWPSAPSSSLAARGPAGRARSRAGGALRRLLGSRAHRRPAGGVRGDHHARPPPRRPAPRAARPPAPRGRAVREPSVRRGRPRDRAVRARPRTRSATRSTRGTRRCGGPPARSARASWPTARRWADEAVAVGARGGSQNSALLGHRVRLHGRHRAPGPRRRPSGLRRDAPAHPRRAGGALLPVRGLRRTPGSATSIGRGA